MSYVAPGIDEAGIHVPSYEDIRDRLTDRFKGIFGDDIYLGTDTQDYQAIAEFADITDDVMGLLVDVFSSRNPDYATGVALDYMLSINGIRRLLATKSTSVLTVTGSNGTVIPSGSRVQDLQGNLWETVSSVTIPGAGTTTVNIRAVVAGAIVASTNTITRIMSPITGWVSATNLEDALPGRNLETDAEVRARRLASVSNSAVSTMEALQGSVAAVNGVLKSRIYENSSSSTSIDNIPAHCICAVVLGGQEQDIANVVFNKKSPGCGTYGNKTCTVVDVYGQNNTVKFTRPDQAEISVNVTIKAFNSYSSEVEARIKSNVADYINKLPIGEDINVGMIYAAVISANESITDPACSPVSITAAKGSGEEQSASVEIDYDEYASCTVDNVTVEVDE